MSFMTNSFTITNHNNLNELYPSPDIIIPNEPRQNTKANYYLPKTLLPQCRYNVQSCETDLSKYENLVNQQSQLRTEIMKINQEMSELMLRMLDGNCQQKKETTMKIREITHEKLEIPVMAQHKSLITTINSQDNSSTKPIIKEAKIKYSDPNEFRYSANKKVHIEPSERINLTRVLEKFFSWNKPFMGRSEYMDTFSKFGMSNLKNHKQYIEPIPSSRRRWSNRNS